MIGTLLLGLVLGNGMMLVLLLSWGIHLERRRRRPPRDAGTAKVAKLHAAEHTVAVLNAEHRDAGRHTIEGR